MTYAELGVLPELGASRMLQDVRGHIVEIVGLVRVREALAEPINEDARVWNLDLDLGVFTVLLLDGQECLLDDTAAGIRIRPVRGKDFLFGLSEQFFFRDIVNPHATQEFPFGFGGSEKEQRCRC